MIIRFSIIFLSLAFCL